MIFGTGGAIGNESASTRPTIVVAHLRNNCVTFVLGLTAVQHIKHRQFEFYFRDTRRVINAGFAANLPAFNAFSRWSTGRPSLTGAGSLPTEKGQKNLRSVAQKQMPCQRI
jgi:hypothetical protein